jgi:hypothetical protein
MLRIRRFPQINQVPALRQLFVVNPLSPVFRSSFQMGNSNNDNRFVCNAIENTVGGPVYQTTPDLHIDLGLD